MSGPMQAHELPEDIRRHHQALAAWQLAAAKWLGIDPAKAFKIELERDRRLKVYNSAQWEATEALTSRIGRPMHAVHQRDDGTETFTASLHLEAADGAALYKAVGPQPKLISDEDEAKLRRAFGV